MYSYYLLTAVYLSSNQALYYLRLRCSRIIVYEKKKKKKDREIWFFVSEHYLVGGHFSGFFVNNEFSSFLIWLLDDGIFHLSVNAFIFVSGVYLLK